jgi:small-conductance mechanosensitive channel
MAMLRRATTPALALLLIAIANEAARVLLGSSEILRIVASLLLAWIVIRVSSAALRDPVWAHLVATATWVLVALNILHLLTPTEQLLDSLAVSAGDLRISVFLLLKGVLIAALLIWIALALARVIDVRLQRVPSLTPSLRVLLAKLFRLGMLAIAVSLVLSSLGISLTSFAVVGGAVGVGIGLGLQKVVSNLVSGLILLLDKSVKPGDVIQIGDRFGWISALNSRYASLTSRDGHEYLIPNEQLITNEVINWSYSSNHIRLEVPVCVSHESDPHQVRELLIGAAQRPARVLRQPAPVCNLVALGDSALEFRLRFWIDDPKNGIQNIKSEVLFAVWDALKAAGITIPFPQHDVHLRDLPPRLAAARERPGRAAE